MTNEEEIIQGSDSEDEKDGVDLKKGLEDKKDEVQIEEIEERGVASRLRSSGSSFRRG